VQGQNSFKTDPLLKENNAGLGQTDSATESRFIEFCLLPLQDTLSRLRTSINGLSSEEAVRRLAEYGPNEPAETKRLGLLLELLSRLKNPLNLQLAAIAFLSFLLGEGLASAIVLSMIVLSMGLSFVLDRRSTKAVESLGKRVQSRTVVLRDGVETEIRISEVVPGDIVVLSAGSIIPADVRLITAKDFFVSESALTGESMPVEKTAGAFPEARHNTALSLVNACFLGTFVVSGSAKAVVINTGRNTLFGSIAQSLTEHRHETSFDKGIKSLTWLLMRLMLVVVSIVFLIVGLTKGNWLEALLFGLSVAVGLTPEMLPMILTVNLAKGALSMAKKKVIVKQLPAIQNFGAIDILCTDKTGTLTQDRVVLERHVDIIGNESEDVLSYAYLNSYYQTGLRSLIDRAVLDYTNLDAERNCRLVDELPFDFQRKRMSVVVDYEGDHVLICKGAVEEIYDCCTHYQIGDEVYPLIDLLRAELFEDVEELAKNGFRVLAVAYREFPRTKTSFTVADESNLTLLGYMAFYDPPKDSAMDAIHLLKKVGVNVKVLTGDNALVTQKVCMDVGLQVSRVVSGSELAAMSSEGFAKAVREAQAFVKLTPSQKEQIVKEFRRQGHVVGFMGDGINDVPALKAADVGISVDSAVDVAKEAADIVLLEKSLLVLEEGILEGRRVFMNIIKYIRMGASSNFGNMFSVIGASYLLPFLPMQPIQILTNNLLYDFSQTGIPTDNVDEELIAKPLKWDIEGIKRFIFCIGPISSIFDYATFALMWFYYRANIFVNEAATAAQKGYAERLFQTGWFVESLITQTLIVYIIRTKRIPFVESQPSLPMLLVTVMVMACCAWLPYSPLSSYLGMVPLPASYWLWIAGFMLSYGVITHWVKLWFYKKYRGH